MTGGKLNVAIVGLGFGREFIPIYQRHPYTNMYAICQRTREKLDEVGDMFGVSKRYTSFEEPIRDPEVDAVHINSPIHLHAPQCVAALRAGKHVACTVPAATSIEECRGIVVAAEAARQELHDDGDGHLYSRVPVCSGDARQRPAGAHPVHARRPPAGDGRMARILGRPASDALRDARRQPLSGAGEGRSRVRVLFRFGRHRRSLAAKYGSPFAVESALFKVRNRQLCFEVTRSLFETARQYVESFDVYGDKTCLRMDAD